MNSVQAVILINEDGNGLYPFSELQPGYLLPVGNKPVLAYVLEHLVANHLSNFIFVCNDKNKEDIEKYVEKKFKWPKIIQNDMMRETIEAYILPLPVPPPPTTTAATAKKRNE